MIIDVLTGNDKAAIKIARASRAPILSANIRGTRAYQVCCRDLSNTNTSKALRLDVEYKYFEIFCDLPEQLPPHPPPLKVLRAPPTYMYSVAPGVTGMMD